MRKHLYTLSICLMAFSAAFLFNGGIFRLHVIANSDSAIDQAAKLAVRDAILDYERDMGNVRSAGEVKRRLMEDGAGLYDAITTALNERGMDYGAELHIGEYDFPEKQYAGRTYPAGRYEALRVILGDGKGKNWWCVMFPPLCITEKPEGQIDDKAEFKSLILELIRGMEDEKNE